MSDQINKATEPFSTLKIIPVDMIVRDPEQPRTNFDEVLLKELAKSIKLNGLINPIIVEQNPDDPDTYLLIHGERRFRAMLLNGAVKIPAFINYRVPNSTPRTRNQLIEEQQREPLKSTEKAAAYEREVATGITAKALAEDLGVSEAHISNHRSLLKLPNPLLELVDASKLSILAANLLGKLAPDEAIAIANDASNKEFGLAQIRARIAALQKQNVDKKAPRKKRIEHSVQKQLKSALNTPVTISQKGNKKTIQIVTTNASTFDAVVALLSAKKQVTT